MPTSGNITGQLADDAGNRQVSAVADEPARYATAYMLRTKVDGQRDKLATELS